MRLRDMSDPSVVSDGIPVTASDLKYVAVGTYQEARGSSIIGGLEMTSLISANHTGPGAADEPVSIIVCRGIQSVNMQRL